MQSTGDAEARIRGRATQREWKLRNRDLANFSAVILFALASAVALAMSAPPATPDAPTVADLGGGVAEVTWIDVDLEDGYDVQRESQKGNGDWFKTTIVASVGANVTSTSDDAGLGVYRYRVRAFNGDGASAWSGWTEVTLTDGGGGDPPPQDIWIAWYVYTPEFLADPHAPVVENMGPDKQCVINGDGGAPLMLRLLTEATYNLFSQRGWGEIGDPHPCPSCVTCGMTVTPTDHCNGGMPTYPIDMRYSFFLESDGSGAITFDFRGSGDPPGGKKDQRFQSEAVLVKNILWDDPNDKANSAFTVEINEPCLLLDLQSGPSDPRYIAIDDVRFEKWVAP